MIDPNEIVQKTLDEIQPEGERMEGQNLIDQQNYEYMSSCAMEHFRNLKEHDDQRNYLRVVLQENIMMVTFEKKNGDERKMYCTLQEAFIPEHKKYFAQKDRAESTDVLAVYDLEKEDWRSFRLDKLTEFEYVNDTDAFPLAGVARTRLVRAAQISFQ